jgi:hypothetical protein
MIISVPKQIDSRPKIRMSFHHGPTLARNRATPIPSKPVISINAWGWASLFFIALVIALVIAGRP